MASLEAKLESMPKTKEPMEFCLGSLALVASFFFLTSCATDPNNNFQTTVTALKENLKLADAWIGSQLSSSLGASEREEFARITETAAQTGENQSWSSVSGDIKGDVEVTETEDRKQQIELKVLKGRLQVIPPVEIIGEKFRVAENSNVRGGPGVGYVIVDGLKKGTVVMVIGLVKGVPWFLIGDGDTVSGFVFEKLLVEIDDQDGSELTLDRIDDSSQPVEYQMVDAETICRTILQKITLADGEIVEENVTACQGPNGWEVR